jgi:hypothetical protein
MNRSTNIIEMASIYDEATAIWFMNNDEFPSKVGYRTFTVDEAAWIKWVDENMDIVNSEHRIRSNDNRIKLRKVVAKLVRNPKVIVAWNINETAKGKTEITQMFVYYSHNFKDFNLQGFDDELASFKLAEEKKSQVYMVVQRQHGLDLQDFEIEIPTLDIEENYGAEWVGKHDKLLEAFTIRKKKGIALLHGLPGTGKSMYIRHLIATLCENRTVVYLPNQLINCITDPGFIPLMAEYSGAILVIEDADEAIKSRKTGGGTVDKLLNLADGILSDFLGMQIICTFNNDISTIDDALLRKGRLIIKHEFGKLEIEAAQKLSDKLGFKTTIEDPMTLAEIYNQEDALSDIESNERTQIGFKR